MPRVTAASSNPWNGNSGMPPDELGVAVVDVAADVVVVGGADVELAEVEDAVVVAAVVVVVLVPVPFTITVPFMKVWMAQW